MLLKESGDVKALMIHFANSDPKRAYLVTEDGAVRRGGAFGYIPEESGASFCGELVYTTSTIGCAASVCDPCYFGQILIGAFPVAGCCGIVPDDEASYSPVLSAYIVRDYCQAPSNFRSVGTLDGFLYSRKVPGLYGIDTRSLVRDVRDRGGMNGIILYEEPCAADYASLLSQYRVSDAVAAVASGTKRAVFTPAGTPALKAAVLDFGKGTTLAASLVARGVAVTLLPYNSSAGDITAESPDCVFISEGPGDPAECDVSAIASLLDRSIPVIGIGLGCELLARAAGASTVKLPRGHRGGNPVKLAGSGRVIITGQNHGYAVDGESLPDGAEVCFVNANDKSCEGFSIEEKSSLGLMFSPDGCANPRDTEYLYNLIFGYACKKAKGVSANA